MNVTENPRNSTWKIRNIFLVYLEDQEDPHHGVDDVHFDKEAVAQEHKISNVRLIVQRTVSLGTLVHYYIRKI